tara:strand:+ start:88 stop:477 length:390 start_codon:yes stop_codon:yes gene_type:complete
MRPCWAHNVKTNGPGLWTGGFLFRYLAKIPAKSISNSLIHATSVGKRTHLTRSFRNRSRAAQSQLITNGISPSLRLRHWEAKAKGHHDESTKNDFGDNPVTSKGKMTRKRLTKQPKLDNTLLILKNWMH